MIRCCLEYINGILRKKALIMALIHIKYSSTILMMQTDIHVLIPENIKKDEHIPVLYLLHGYMGNYSDWVRLSSIERYLFDKRLIVVMPSGNNSYYNDLADSDQKYESYITKELPDYIESLFNLSSEKTHRYIAGLSMGGYGALKIAFKNSHRYQKVGSFSGALDVDRFSSIDSARKPMFLHIFNGPVSNTQNDIFHLLDSPMPSELDIFLSCGTKDMFYPDTLRLKAKLDDMLMGYTYFELPLGHEWVFWDHSIKQLLEWL